MLFLLASTSAGNCQLVQQATECVSTAAAAGTVNVITIPLQPCGVTTTLVVVTALGANTGPATMKQGGLPTLPILKGTGVPLVAGDIEGAAFRGLYTQDGVNWWLLNPASSGGGGGGGSFPLGSGFTTIPGADNTSPLVVGTNTLYGQTFDTDTTAGSYTFLTTDIAHLKTFSSGSPQNAVLPTAGGVGFEQGNLVCFLVTGTGGVTLSTTSGSLLGISSSVFPQNTNACAESSPPNWNVSAGTLAGGGSGVTSLSEGTCIVLTPNPIIATGTVDTLVPLTVPCGGTGQTTLTANSVLLGNNTSPVGFAAPNTAGWVLTDNGIGVAPTFQPAGAGSALTELAFFMPGVPPNSAIIDQAQTIGKVCPVNLTGSVALAEIASTGTAIVTIIQITGGVPTGVGTITFTASTTGVIASAGFTLAVADRLELSFPAFADATLQDIAVTLQCTRV